MSKNNKERHPRVFISYSHDSPEHADKILEFAKHLREDGIDAILDQYEPWPVKGWAQWMLQQVSEADFVLMICTEMYYKGVMDKLAPGEKRGIKYEWNLINNHFYKAGSVNKRFLPVFLEKTCAEWIPDPFQPMPWFCIVTDEGYDDLYRRLTNQPKTKRPKLGKLKSLEVREVKINFFADASGDEYPYLRTYAPPSPAPEPSPSPAPEPPPSPAPAPPPMDKSKKKTTDIVVAVCALLTLGFMILIEYRTSMIAIIKGGPWQAPQSVKTDLKAADGLRNRAIDPNRMTAADANGVCSMYIVCIHNKGKHTMKNPQMSVPKALHWEVSWEDTEGPQKEEYSVRETISLPAIECMRNIDVTIWSASEATRPNAGKILVTQDGHGEARLDIRTPVWERVQSLSQHIKKVLWIGVILVVIVLVMWRQRGALAAIGTAIRRRVQRTLIPQ